ncbi:MAG: hypothetical protein IPM92_09400 [Saprospiraceae bacterium]|nr:hypothetical protein [Saprospiraceae bacterium]
MTKYIYIFLFYIVILPACANDQTEVEKISRHKADSLFQLQIPALEGSIDSICIHKMNYALQYKLDSIVLQRKSEIIKLQKGL